METLVVPPDEAKCPDGKVDAFQLAWLLSDGSSSLSGKCVVIVGPGDLEILPRESCHICASRGEEEKEAEEEEEGAVSEALQEYFRAIHPSHRPRQLEFFKRHGRSLRPKRHLCLTAPTVLHRGAGSQELAYVGVSHITAEAIADAVESWGGQFTVIDTAGCRMGTELLLSQPRRGGAGGEEAPSSRKRQRVEEAEGEEAAAAASTPR